MSSLIVLMPGNLSKIITFKTYPIVCRILRGLQIKMKIGIITDIHENVEMLREALRLASVNKCDEIVCLGDIVGYDQRFYTFIQKRSATTCLDLVRSNCRWIVPGNHDLFAAGRVPSYTNGFKYPDTWFEMNAGERKKVAQGKVWCYGFNGKPFDNSLFAFRYNIIGENYLGKIIKMVSLPSILETCTR